MNLLKRIYHSPIIRKTVEYGAVGAAAYFGGPAAGTLAKNVLQSIFGG